MPSTLITMKTPFLCLGLVIILFGTSCADAGKDFSEKFKTGWLSSCQKQAGVNMAQSQAKEYCQCSLDIVMERYENDEEAGEAIASMSMNRIQQILVLPCIQ